MKISEEQKKQTNHNSSLFSFYLDKGVRKTLIEIKNKLVSGDTADLIVGKDRIPEMIQSIENMENPDSEFN